MFTTTQPRWHTDLVAADYEGATKYVLVPPLYEDFSGGTVYAWSVTQAQTIFDTYYLPSPLTIRAYWGYGALHAEIIHKQGRVWWSIPLNPYSQIQISRLVNKLPMKWVDYAVEHNIYTAEVA